MIRLMVLAMSLTCSASVGFAQSAKPADPTAAVKEAYAVTIRQLTNNRGEPPFRPPHRQRLMTKELSALFARDELFMKESEEMGHIGADPFISGQDGEVKKLAVRVSRPPAAGKAEVTAAFVSFGQAVRVRFQMAEEGGRWLIDDIVNSVEGTDSTVRQQLSQPYECGSFMKKPCKR